MGRRLTLVAQVFVQLTFPFRSRVLPRKPLGGLVGPQRGDLRFSSRDAYGEPGVPFRTFVNVAAVQAHCGGLKSDDQRQAAPAIPQLRPEFYCGAGKAGAWTFRKIPTLALIVRSANSSELPLRTSEEVGCGWGKGKARLFFVSS